MATVKQISEMIGIEEGNMQMFLDLYAIEVKAGSTLEDAIRNVHTMLVEMAEESLKAEDEQAGWYRALKQALAVDVWHAVRRRSELQQIFS